MRVYRKNRRDVNIVFDCLVLLKIDKISKFVQKEAWLAATHIWDVWMVFRYIRIYRADGVLMNASAKICSYLFLSVFVCCKLLVNGRMGFSSQSILPFYWASGSSTCSKEAIISSMQWRARQHLPSSKSRIISL